MKKVEPHNEMLSLLEDHVALLAADERSFGPSTALLR